MKLDVRGCAEFQKLRPPYLDTVSHVEIKGSVFTYFYEETGLRPVSFDIGDDYDIPKGDRFWKEVNVLKKHFPEAFI